MHLRHRLTLLIGVFVLLTIVAAGLYASQIQRRALERVSADRLRPIAEAAAAAIDPEAYARVLRSKDESSPDYQALAAALGEIRRREGLRGLHAGAMDKSGLPRVVVDTREGAARLRIWQPYGGGLSDMKAGMAGALAGKYTAEPMQEAKDGWLTKKAYMPIGRPGQAIGFVVCEEAVARGDRVRAGARRDIVGGALFLLLLGVVGAYLVARYIAEPLQVLSQHAQRIAVGAPARPFKLKRTDEIGALAASIWRVQAEFNQFITRVNGLLTEARGYMESIRAFTTGLRREIEQGISSVAVFGEDTGRSVAAAETGSAELMEASGILAGLAEQAATLSATAAEARGSGLTGLAMAGAAADEVKKAGTELDRAVERTGFSTESARAIGGMIGAIEDIAAQTTTLALNATIEAAHAGEFGHGFAVVARRIQRLAVSAKETVAKIRVLLAEIVATATAGADAAANGRAAVDAAGSYVEEAAAAFGETNARVESLAAVLDAVAANSGSLASGTGETGRKVRVMAEAMTRAGDGIAQMGATAADKLTAAERLLIAANGLTAAMETLAADVARFHPES